MQVHAAQGRLLWLVLVVMVAAATTLSLAPWKERDPNKVWSQAEKDLHEDRITLAEAGLGRLRRLRAPTAVDEMLTAQIALARHRNDEALTALARIPGTDAMGPQARLLEGQVELRRGRLPAAEKALREAVRLDPKLIQAHRELVYLYSMQFRRAELSAEFGALSKLTTLTFANLFHWGLTRNNFWEPVEHRDSLGGFLKAEPSDRWSRLGLAECLQRLGQRDEADSVLAVLPDSDPEARVIRVRLALDRGDDQRAEEILRGGPTDHPELARLRGRFALAHGDGDEALRQFRFAYEQEPDNRDNVFGMLSALKQLGRDDEAAPFIDQARNQDILASLLQRASAHAAEKDPLLPKQFGAACEALGRLLEARGWYQLAIARDTLDSEAQQALFRIKSKLSRETPDSDTRLSTHSNSQPVP